MSEIENRTCGTCRYWTRPLDESAGFGPGYRECDGIDSAPSTDPEKKSFTWPPASVFTRSKFTCVLWTPRDSKGRR